MYSQLKLTGLQQQLDAVEAPSIATAAMLMAAPICVWEGARTDKRVTKEVAAAKGAAVKAGRYRKSLLPNCKELEEIKQLRNKAKEWHREHTLPWSNYGLRLLPTKGFAEYHEVMTGFQQEFYDLVDRFIAVYDMEIVKAQAQITALGALFDPADYPSVDTLRGKFSFRLDPMPLPDSGDFRIDIGEQTKQALQEQYTHAYTNHLQEAMKDVWSRLATMLKNMSLRLDYSGDDKPTGFHDTLVTNVTDHLKIMDTCNITNDPEMARVRNELADLFYNVSATTLRRNETHRLRVKDRVDQVIANLPTFEL